MKVVCYWVDAEDSSAKGSGFEVFDGPTELLLWLGPTINKRPALSVRIFETQKELTASVRPNGVLLLGPRPAATSANKTKEKDNVVKIF